MRNSTANRAGQVRPEDRPEVFTVVPVLDTSAYADNDVMFVPVEVPNFFGKAGGTRVLRSVMVLDGDDQSVDFDLLFMNATGTVGTINSAVSISDADAAKVIGHVSLSGTNDVTDLVNSVFYSKGALDLMMKAAGGSNSLWVAGIVRSGTPTYTAAGMSIQLAVG